MSTTSKKEPVEYKSAKVVPKRIRQVVDQAAKIDALLKKNRYDKQLKEAKEAIVTYVSEHFSRDNGVKIPGSSYNAVLTPCKVERKLTDDIELRKELLESLGADLFWSLIKIDVKDLEKYLDPGDFNRMVESERGTGGRTFQFESRPKKSVSK